MSTKAIGAPAPIMGVSPVVRISDAFAWISRSAREWIAFRNARGQLMALDDRMLRDIGLDRSEITSALTDTTGERRRTVPWKALSSAQF